MLFEFFYDYNDTWHSHVLTDYGFLDCFSLCIHIDYNDTELDTDILKIIMLLILLMSP